MSIEKGKKGGEKPKPTVREIESRHHEFGSHGFDADFAKDNTKALNMAKNLLVLGEAKVFMDRKWILYVKNLKGEIIFSTSFHSEIADILDVAPNSSIEPTRD